MKKISRKLIMSILSMAFAIIALGTTTFAWFTMNSTATATINVNVQSGTDGILISKDCKTFASSAALGDSSTILKPVTYVMDGADLSADDTWKDLDGAAASTSVLSFDLYLKTDTAVSIYFENSSSNAVTSVESSRKSYSVLSGFSYQQDGEEGSFATNSSLKADSVNALRSVVDFYDGAVLRADAQEVANGGQSLSTLNFGSAVRHSELFSFTGDYDAVVANSLSHVNGTGYNFGQELTNDNAANSYLEAINGSGYLSGKAVDAEYAALDTVNGFAASTTALTNITDEAAIVQDRVMKVTFYFWLEGFDADCFDAIMGQTINISLAFTTKMA